MNEEKASVPIKKIDFDDKDIAMAGIVVLALPVLLMAVAKGSLEVASSVFGIAVAALGGLATGRKRPE